MRQRRPQHRSVAVPRRRTARATPPFAALVAALRRTYRVALAPVQDRPPCLRLVLDDAAERLVVVLATRSDGPCCRQTADFNVSYEGSAALSPGQARMLGAVVHAVERLERRCGGRWRAAWADTGGSAGRPADERPEVGEEGPIAVNRWQRRDGGEECEVILRLTDRCNLHCTFCQVQGLRFRPSASFVRAALRRQAREHGAATLSLSGGEPTLDPHLAEHVALALGLPFGRVCVQTNGLRFAEPAFVARFPPAPRLSFFVSFHGHTPRLYDAATATAGRFDAAVRGIRNLLDAGHPVVLNYVVTQENVAHLTALVRAVPRLFPDRRGRLALNLSTLSQFPAMDERVALLPRLSDVLRQSRKAAVAARRLGLSYYDFLRTGACTLPPCLLTAAERRRIRAVSVCAPADERRPAVAYGLAAIGDAPTVKNAGCRRCAFDAGCRGVPRAYATAFGLGELRPVETADG